MNKTTTIIGISGASGAGKSVLARHLHKRLIGDHELGHAQILHEDSYYRDRSDLSFEVRELINYDHPDALEHDLLVQHLQALRNGESVEVPQYDYATHNRRAETAQLDPVPVIILEGILILHDPRVREQLDLKIYVDVPLDTCLMRRLRRDTQQRSRTLDSVLAQYE
ncbi:MAG: uridine kinase, partial [Pirellulaceae bacterium]